MEFTEQNDYSTGFFGCFEDPLNCVITWFVPCVSTGLLVGKQTGDEFNSCLCYPLGAYRARRHNLSFHGKKESEDSTMVAVACCLPCTVCQDTREWNHLKENRGQMSVMPTTAPPPQV